MSAWGNMIDYNLEELLPLNTPTWLVHAHFKDLKDSECLLNEYYAGKAEYYIFESRMKHKTVIG
jgi:hypothetical protein